MSEKNNEFLALKFEGIDLIATMGSIVEVHTKGFKGNFYCDDVRYLNEAVDQQDEKEKGFLWLCMTEGTVERLFICI